MDVICPRHKPVCGTGTQGDLFLLDLDSEAFAIGNQLVIVHGPQGEGDSWLGTYRVIDKTVFAADSLSNMLSLMIFGVSKTQGIAKLRAFLEASSPRTNVRCCFVCVRRVEETPCGPTPQYWPESKRLRRTPRLEYRKAGETTV
jgi:hypothetical protein